MYPLFIASGLAVSILLSFLLIPKEPFYFSGPILGLIAFVPTFYLISRKISDKIAPILELAQRQTQSGSVDQAILTFKQALGYKNWQLFLERQINNQIGSLYYASGDEKTAVEYLRKGYPKAAEGHLLLGSVLYRDEKFDEAREALETGIRFNKKSPILYNVLAYLLHKEGKFDDAIALLEKGLKKPIKDDADTAENLKRLRNKKKLSMKPFGQLWYMLKFETMPGMVSGQPLRKGFRQPPKGQGRRRKR